MKKILEMPKWFLFLLWLPGSSKCNIIMLKVINLLPDPRGSSLPLEPLIPSSQMKKGVQIDALP